MCDLGVFKARRHQGCQALDSAPSVPQKQLHKQLEKTTSEQRRGGPQEDKRNNLTLTKPVGTSQAEPQRATKEPHLQPPQRSAKPRSSLSPMRGNSQAAERATVGSGEEAPAGAHT